MTSGARMLPYGDRAVLLEPADPRAVLSILAAARSLPEVVDVVPGARTVLVRLVSPAALAASAATLQRLVRCDAPTAAAASGAGVEIDVHYDGPDLAGTAAELGIDAAELVRRHTAGDYVAAFCGFVPGFAYLTGSDPSLHVARLAEPRTRVPAGAVGIAGEFTGVYPRASPGGWRLIGRSDVTLWDERRDPPALLAPGTRVRFRPA